MSKINTEIIENLVFNLEKPARYIGGELNQIVKEDPFIRIAVSYPDLYEVGMSNNGVRILYDIANSIPDVACERVFAVPMDFEIKIRDRDLPLYTLETFTPLYELDMIGINVSTELLYTNILQILDIGKIPIYRKDRNENFPIIIAGGEAVSNPTPIWEFIDAFYCGDGEEGIIDILDAIRISKLKSLGRGQLLDLLSEIEGLAVPSKYRFNYESSQIESVVSVNGNGKLISIEGKRIRKRAYSGISLFDPVKPVVPNIRISQGRSVIEVTRGCKNFCKFCHAGYYNLPYRHYSPEALSDRIFRIIENTGYNDLTLSSLSISDYSYLTRLLNLVLPYLSRKGLSISLPSLRVDKGTLQIIEKISDIRKASLTFAVESACDEIRRVSNKQLSIDDLLTIINYIFTRGWRRVKIYFMIGLPGCEDYDEADLMIKFLKKIYHTWKKRKEINVTISPFVPKPHTPFQWERQMSIEYFEDTIRKVKQNLPKSIKIKNHNPRASILEGVLARGDTSLNKVIYASYMDGCRLDSWNEFFNFNIWEKNLNSLIPDWKKFLLLRGSDEVFPWNFISTGYERLINFKRDKISSDKECSFEDKGNDDNLNLDEISESIDFFKIKYKTVRRIRLRFSKLGNARFIPQIDFIEIIKRSLRMTDIPVSFTQGYNKRERISMGYPLSVGIESISELCEVNLYDDIEIDKIQDDMNIRLPKGIRVVDTRFFDKTESIMSITVAMGFSIDVRDDAFFRNCIRNLESGISFMKETKKRSKRVGFDDVIIDYSIKDKKIDMKIGVGSENSMRIDNIMLGLAEVNYDMFYKFRVLKVCQYRRINDELVEII